MGETRFTREAYTKASERLSSSEGPKTRAAEQQAKRTGKLNPLVDPSGHGVIRLSLPRFEKQDNGLWRLTVGTPIPIETCLDTTGSMGSNVEVAIDVLPNSYEFCSGVLPGCDVQIATGIFGDVSDNFPLCRPQFEMEADKILNQLTLMVPEGQGGDAPEDPHYGLFAGAYLTSSYINKIGLKGYYFTVSDAPARDLLDERQLKRIFGNDVFEKVSENGHQISQRNLPTTFDVVQDLLNISHAFFLQVGTSSGTTEFWKNIFPEERIVILPSTKLLPQVQATIIGLTEGTLGLFDVEEFLLTNNVNKENAKAILRSVSNIPIGEQVVLPNYSKKPKAGDLFREKTDLWPIDPSELGIEEKKPEKGPAWL